MDTIEEKRVYGDRTGSVVVFIAAEIGLVAVSVAGDRVGEFGLVHACTPRAIAGMSGRLVVATDDDVLIDESFTPTEFGPATAVGFIDGHPVAAAPDGRVCRLNDTHEEVAVVPRATAIDGELVGTPDGVYRIGATPVNVGLTEVRDVAAAGVPLAATAAGLYTLGNGWMDVLPGDFHVVTQAEHDDRAHAATTDGFFERTSTGWQARDLPVDGRVVGVAYDDATYAVTADGVLLAQATDQWTRTDLGVRAVRGIAVP